MKSLTQGGTPRLWTPPRAGACRGIVEGRFFQQVRSLIQDSSAEAKRALPPCGLFREHKGQLAWIQLCLSFEKDLGAERLVSCSASLP